MATDKKVLDRIRKILAKAKDPAASEAEVEIFMKKAQELMMKHQLEEGDIDLHPSDIDKDVLFSDLWKAFKYKHKNFEWDLIDTICGFYNCEVYHKETYDFDNPDVNWKSTKKIRLSLVGSSENRQIVSEMYETLVHKFLSLSNIRYKEYQTSRKKEIIDDLKSMGLDTKGLTVKYFESVNQMTRKGTWVASYLSGCINGLKQVLKSQQKQLLAAEADRETWGLIVAKHDALIKARVPELIGKVKYTNISNKAGYDGNAYAEGIKDGKTNHNTKMLN